MSKHGDFKTVEASRPPFDITSEFKHTQTHTPSWKIGTGATSDDWKHHHTITINPYADGRSPIDNYKLLISGVIPRPIGFVSTVSKHGLHNLAPFSYFQLVNHDPPMFTLGFSIARGTPKDTLVQLLETGECTINIISEWFVEAANYTSINAPPGVSEWEMSGLTKGETVVVKAPRVKESVFAVEAKLVTHHEWTGKQSGKHTGTLAILEGVMFHVREDALDMSKGGVLDPAKLKAVSRLGGVTFGRTESGFELTRPEYNKEKEKEEFQEAVGGKPTDERL